MAKAEKVKKVFTGISKKKYEASETARKNANKRALTVKTEMEEALESATQMELIWTAVEGGATIAGAVANGVTMGLVDKFVEEDWDLALDIGAVVIGTVAGVASAGVGALVAPRIGCFGMALSAGFAAPSAADLARMGTAKLLDMALPPKVVAPPAEVPEATTGL